MTTASVIETQPTEQVDLVIDYSGNRDHFEELHMKATGEHDHESILDSPAFAVIRSEDGRSMFTDVRSQLSYVEKVRAALGYPRDVDTVAHEQMMDSTLVYTCLVSTFCFFPLGAPALVMAVDARAAMARGDPAFYQLMRKAEKLAVVALFTGLTAWGFGIVGLLFNYYLYADPDLLPV